MGKQKDFRHYHHEKQKKKDKKFDKASKLTRSSFQVGFSKNFDGVIQELDSLADAKGISKKIRNDLDRYPVLAKAAFLGSERILDSILEAGENVNEQVQDGSTPLILAVENGNTGIVQKLLKKGADPRLLRQDGRNALMIAIDKNDKYSFTLIWNSWEKNNFCELNHRDLQGYTALAIAAEKGYLLFIKFLLSLNGVEIDTQTDGGQSPLMLSVLGSHSNIAKMLCDKGADITLEDKKGTTAVCLAVSQNMEEIKKMLLEYLDRKSKELYVKKRIELLSKPKMEDIFVIIPFYKNILFWVILDVRRHFDGGVMLLEKYMVFHHLLTCMEKYQQDMEFLRIGFHLSVCIIYDKAECSRYIVEHLAEQYIHAKGLDFSLKIMSNCRFKSLSDFKGAAFLPIHACTQCRSGQEWLKRNFIPLLPFVEEFKLKFPSMTFWADGEKVNAQIMFERFEEIFRNIGKEFKSQMTSSEKSNSTKKPPLEPPKKEESVPSNEIDSNTADPNQQKWCVVSHSKSSSNKVSHKLHTNQSSKSSLAKNKRTKKFIKLQTKLKRRNAVRKITPNFKVQQVPGLSRDVSAVLASEKCPIICYADALKRNLKSRSAGQQVTSTGIKDPSYTSKDVMDDCLEGRSSITDFDKSSEKKQRYDGQELLDLDENEFSKVLRLSMLKNEDKTEMEDLYNLWSKISQSKSPASLVTFLINMLDLKNATNISSKPNHRTSVAERLILNGPPQKTNLKEKQNEHIAGESNLSFGKHSAWKTENNRFSFNHASIGRPVEAGYDSNNAAEYPPLSQTDENLKIMKSEEKNLKCDLDSTFKSFSSSEKNYSTISVEKTSNKKSNLSFTLEDFMSSEIYNNSTPDEMTDNLSSNLNLNSSFGSYSSSNLCNMISEEKSHDSSIGIVPNLKKNSEFNCVNDSSEGDGILVSSPENLSEISGNISTNVRKRKYTETNLLDLCFNFYKEEMKNGSRYFTSTNDSYKVKEFGDFRTILKNEETPGISQISVNKNTSVHMSDDQRSNVSAISNLNIRGNSLPGKCNLIQNGNNISNNYLGGGDFCKFGNKNLKEISSTPNFHHYFQTTTKKMKPVVNVSCESEQIGDGEKDVSDLVAHGFFSDFDPKLYSDKFTKRLATKKKSALSLSKIHSSQAIKFCSIQKYVELYHRLIFHKIMKKPEIDGFLTTDSNKLSGRSIYTDLEFVSGKELTNNTSTFTHSNLRGNDENKSLAIQKGRDSLYQLKSNFTKLFHSRISHPTEKIYETRKSIKRNSIRSSNSKECRVSKLSKLDSLKSLDNLFNFKLQGFKPQFINCESSSKWYKILQRIDSNVPLASFLMDPRELKNIFTENFIHELIYSTGKIHFSSKEEHILRDGKFGTYLGLISNGNPVVVRHLQKSPQEAAILLSRYQRLNHKNIAALYSISESPLYTTVFSVTELCESSLSEHLQSGMMSFEGRLLVQELVEAVKYLHGKRIVHGFLKPSNVMVTIDHRIKVTDFFLLDVSPLVCGIVERSDIPELVGFSDFSWRPYELIATTTLSEARQFLTTASDVQMTGMLIYYILSGGKHPFGTFDLECQVNIRNGNPSLDQGLTDFESVDLVKNMIKMSPSSRPTMNLVAKHPYFWNIERRFQFLISVAGKIEFFTRKPTKFAEALYYSCLEARGWTSCIGYQLLKYMSEMMNKTYVDNFADLLLFALGLQDSFCIMPMDLKRAVHHPSLFILQTFPTIFMSVYCVVREDPGVQKQMSLQAYF